MVTRSDGHQPVCVHFIKHGEQLHCEVRIGHHAHLRDSLPAVLAWAAWSRMCGYVETGRQGATRRRHGRVLEHRTHRSRHSIRPASSPPASKAPLVRPRAFRKHWAGMGVGYQVSTLRWMLDPKRCKRAGRGVSGLSAWIGYRAAQLCMPQHGTCDVRGVQSYMRGACGGRAASLAGRAAGLAALTARATASVHYPDGT
jgi:hypothetical protein